MPTIIMTGDPQKCRTITLLECVACGEAYNLLDGKLVPSITLDDSVSVCAKHGKALTAAEEVRVQDCLKRAIDCDDGYVQANGVILKNPKIMELSERKR